MKLRKEEKNCFQNRMSFSAETKYFSSSTVCSSVLEASVYVKTIWSPNNSSFTLKGQTIFFLSTCDKVGS